ncbi:MAG: hypothetical protein GXP08_05165 [Gammaproteobacteria bacterium]|nr:hypothetical protein [Gammaproteobacteria bacterium]
MDESQSTVYLQRCRHHIGEAIRCFRLGMEPLGNDNLMKFADHLLPLLAHSKNLYQQHDNQLLETVFAAQSRGDFAYLADLLQYEIPTSGIGDLLYG